MPERKQTGSKSTTSSGLLGVVGIKRLLKYTELNISVSAGARSDQGVSTVVQSAIDAKLPTAGRRARTGSTTRQSTGGRFAVCTARLAGRRPEIGLNISPQAKNSHKAMFSYTFCMQIK